ncbi:MAG TPA: polysaccharide deacetylase family protein [Noviherbaspirillum sp.]|uniref:polysaccharide deacetylase family protein n=1 Tax=Noviherbaspirillum sp. TaxID=1926288 RepID=UPI002D50B221|nr:polysaccharide deacetylase family protein [Noviherbaspirillum sp.]HYD97609.1 polysaccharide deacetylase family protein [Noviherbaspirillum sp.]
MERKTGPVFTCSIDDGHPADMKTAELLHKHGLNGTFFIPIRNCEGDAVMSDAQIRELGSRFEIGSHTYDHRYLKKVDIWQAYHQIADGKKQLEDLLGVPVNGFCYPGGRYTRRDVELVRACGFSYARTTMNLCFDSGNTPFEMPTTLQFYPHDRAVYLRNFAGSGKWHKRIDGLCLAVGHDNWIERLYAMFDHACRNDRTFHLWWHSKQIEELNAWHDIDAFFRHVASKIAVVDRLSNEQLAARTLLGNGLRVGEALKGSAPAS